MYSRVASSLVIVVKCSSSHAYLYIRQKGALAHEPEPNPCMSAHIHIADCLPSTSVLTPHIVYITTHALGNELAHIQSYMH